MHCFVNKCNFNHEEMKCYSKIYQGCKFKRSIGYGYPLPRRRSLLSRKLGKAEELSIFFDDNKEAHLLEECRSRYAKFFGHQYVEHKLCVVTCDRELSRVPFKRLTRLLHKSRKIQKMVRKYVVKNVPMSSKMQCCVNKCNFNHEEIRCYSKIYQGCKLKRNIGSGNPLTRRRRLLCRKLLHSKLKIYKKSIYCLLLLLSNVEIFILAKLCIMWFKLCLNLP